MKHKYYCKKCGRIEEFEEYDTQFGEYDTQFGELKRVWCPNCRGGVRMWKVIKEKLEDES